MRCQEQTKWSGEAEQGQRGAADGRRGREARTGIERYGLTQALVSLLSRQPGTSPQALL